MGVRAAGEVTIGTGGFPGAANPARAAMQPRRNVPVRPSPFYLAAAGEFNTKKNPRPAHPSPTKPAFPVGCIEVIPCRRDHDERKTGSSYRVARPRRAGDGGSGDLAAEVAC